MCIWSCCMPGLVIHRHMSLPRWLCSTARHLSGLMEQACSVRAGRS